MMTSKIKFGSRVAKLSWKISNCFYQNGLGDKKDSEILGSKMFVSAISLDTINPTQ